MSFAAVVTLFLAFTPWVDSIFPNWLPPVQALIRVWAIVAVVGLVLSLFARAWWSMTAFFVAALAASLVIVNVNVSNCAPSDIRLSVLVLNTEFSSAPPEEVAREVAKRKVDVLILAEVHTAYVEDLMAREELSDLRFRSGVTPDEVVPDGTVILSRFEGKPFEVDGVAATFGQPGLELFLGDKRVTVRAVHPKPPIPKWLPEWRVGLQELGMWQRTVKGEPIIMAGDFNASRAHPAFRDASHRMDSAVGRVGKSTWPDDRAFPPFTDIDHVLTREMVTLDHETLTFSETDHRGIWTNLAICK